MPVLVLRRPPIATLAERLERFGPERARREPKFVLRAWRQLALAVRALHRIGVVHRDIKPSNVLWLGSAAAPHFWLSDLGIAARQGTQVHGLEGLMSGTLSHMSVNQLGRGSASFADDLYALGVTFREMLVGQTVWTLDPGRPENHVELHWVNEFGTYPILRGLPDPVAAVVPPSLQRLVDGRDTSDDSIDALLERLAVDPT
jgi:serine/threonine protein kinase